MDRFNDELTLRELVDILLAKRLHVLSLVLLSAALAAVYVFFIADEVYSSTAELSVSPTKVKARLESKIELQPIIDISPDIIKSLAKSQPLMTEVAERLLAENLVPNTLKGENSASLAILLSNNTVISVSQTNKNTSGSYTVRLEARTENPQFSAIIANVWAEATSKNINKLSVSQAEANLKALEENIQPAESEYREAEKAWEVWSSKTPLTEWKEELAMRIDKQAKLALEVEAITHDIENTQAKLDETRRLLDKERSTLIAESDPLASELAGESLNDARKIIRDQLKSAESLYNETSQNLVLYTSRTPINRWKNELEKYRGRLSAVELRLKTINTDISKQQAILSKMQEQLSATPYLVTLKREVLSDPIVALATIKADLQSLDGLELKNESLNPTYVELISQRNKAQASLSGLSAEKDALEEEKGELAGAIEVLRSQIAKAEQELSRLNAEASLAKKHYLKIAALELDYREGRSDLQIEPNSEVYQKIKLSLINQEINFAELQARYSGLREQIEQNKKRLSDLQQSIAVAETDKDFLSRELNRTREAYWALKQKQTDLGIELASMQNSMAQIIIPAYPEPKPIAPQKVTILALSTFMGLILGIFWAFVSAALEAPENKQQANNINN